MHEQLIPGAFALLFGLYFVTQARDGFATRNGGGGIEQAGCFSRFKTGCLGIVIFSSGTLFFVKQVLLVTAQ